MSVDADDLPPAKHVCRFCGFEIDEAAVRAWEDIAHARISSLTGEQRAVLETMLKVGSATSGTIYEAFADRLEDLPVDRTVRKWLAEKFPQYNLVTKRETEHPTEYELTDAAKAILRAGYNQCQ